MCNVFWSCWSVVLSDRQSLLRWWHVLYFKLEIVYFKRWCKDPCQYFVFNFVGLPSQTASLQSVSCIFLELRKKKDNPVFITAACCHLQHLLVKWEKNPHRYCSMFQHHQFVMFNMSKVASTTSASAHDILRPSSTSLRERPWTHCFQSTWVYAHVIGSEVETLRCGLHLPYAKHVFILPHQMQLYFLLLWVETRLSRPLPWCISPRVITEHECKWRFYKESVALWFWWCFRSFTHFLLLNPIGAALEICWHCVTMCTFIQLYHKRHTSQ